MKILHIEDNLEIQTTITLLFKVIMPDADVFTTASGSEGIEVARCSQPDIILLDLGLPDIHGYEVIRLVREFSRTPIIVMTACHDEVVKTTCLQLGADDFIGKPFKYQEVVAGINRVMQNMPERRNAEPLKVI